MTGIAQALAPYAEFSRVGFVNILAFRLRYFTGIITYFLNVTVYYFIWGAVYHSTPSIAGYNLPQIITYISVGWIIRSFYWNTIDQEMAYEVIEGKIAMDLIKPVSVQWMWIFRAMGESAFRLGLLTLPVAIGARAGVSPEFPLFYDRRYRQLFPDGRDQFHDRHVRHSVEIHPRTDPRQILAHRVAFRLAPPNFIFPGARAKNHGLAAVRAYRIHSAANLSRETGSYRGAARPRHSVPLGCRAAAARALLVGARLAEDHHTRRLDAR
jgi:hypothetical protein